MFLSTLKFLQLLTGLVLTGLFLGAPALTSALHPEIPAIPAVELYTKEPSLLIMLATAIANLISGCYQSILPFPRKPLQILASLGFITAATLSAINMFLPFKVELITAYGPQTAVSLLVLGLMLHTVCNLHQLNPSQTTVAGASSAIGLDTGRETGAVKWFNTSKGFGFITRDSGEDIFVHYRAIRGDGHRVLSDGQRVSFIVNKKEKGLQAEDVTTHN